MTLSRLVSGGSAAFLHAGFGPRIMLAPDDGGGAGGGGGDAGAAGAAAAAGGGDGAAAGAGGAAAAAGQAGGDGGGSAAPYRPDGLPDHLIGKDERETIDKLWTAQKGYREAQAKFEPPPADVSGYAFEFSDKVKPYAADFGEDKFFGGVKEDLLAAGIGSKTANAFLDKVLGRMIDMQLVDAPVDVEAEKARLAPAEARNLPPAERDAAIQKRVSTNIAFVESLSAKGFDKDAATALTAELAAFPELNQLVEFMRLGQGVSPALGGNPPAGATAADLEKRVADPRQRFGTPAYDAQFAAETDRLFKQVHGG
jgi:hypothetical protein